MGHNPLLSESRHLLLGHQNLCFSTMIVIYGSPIVVYFFCGSLTTNVKNHWFRQQEESCSALLLFSDIHRKHFIYGGIIINLMP